MPERSPGMSRPPCIAHLTYALGQGGVERGIVQLATRLPAERFRQIVISLAEPSDLAEEIGTHRVFRLGKGPGNDLKLVLRLARILRTERVDLLHARGWATLLEGRLAAWLAPGCRMIYGYHGKTFEDLAQPRRRRLIAQRLLLPRMQALVAVSPTAAREWLGEVGLEVQVELIPDGIPLAPPVRPETRAALRRELGVPAGSICVGSVGRLDPVKDQATLLRTMASLAASGLDAVCLLVGDGPERPSLTRLAGDLGLRERVRFLGSRRDVPRLLPAFDLFVQASLSEALPNALLEGLGAGLPVVATAVGGTLDVVRPEVGLLVPPADPAAMALAVLRLARDPELRHRLGTAGRALVSRRYSLDAMLTAYADLYARLLPPPAPAWAGAMRKAG